MLCTVTKSFRNSRGETLPPGSTIDIPDTMLLKMAGYVQPMGQADNAPSDPRAWLTDSGELRVQGVFAGDYPAGGLAPEIVRLTSGNLELQAKLLKLHVGVFSAPDWRQTLATKLIDRAAALFEEKGLHHRDALYEAATELHLLAFESELDIKFHTPVEKDTPPF